MITVAFPGGAGGHFLGFVVDAVLKQKLHSTSASINFHSRVKPDQCFLNFSFLDTGLASQQEEQCYINEIRPTSGLVLGHFRNIDALYAQHHCAIVVVHAAAADHDLLVSRVLREAIDSNFNGIKYQDVRGQDWPEKNPGFKNLPRWIQLEIESQLHKMFYFWNQQIICNTAPALKISTQDIFHGKIVEEIAEYLQRPVVPGLEQLHENYKQLVAEKYLKNSRGAL